MKKIASILLALVMVLTLLPAAWAGGEDASAAYGTWSTTKQDSSVAQVGDNLFYTNVADAIIYAVSGDVSNVTITLLDDGDIQSRASELTIPTGKHLTINLSGHILWTDTAGLAALDAGEVGFSGTGSVDATDRDEDNDPVKIERREYKNSVLSGTTKETITYYADETLKINNHTHKPIPCFIGNDGEIKAYICGVCGICDLSAANYASIPEGAQVIIGKHYFPNNEVKSGKEKETVVAVELDGEGNKTFESEADVINQGCGFGNTVSSKTSWYKNGNLIRVNVDSTATTENSLIGISTTTDGEGNFIGSGKTVTTLTGSTLTIVDTGLDKNGAATDVITMAYTVSGQKATLTKKTDTIYLANANAGEAATNETEWVYDDNGNLTTEVDIHKDSAGNVLIVSKSSYTYSDNTTTCTKTTTYAGDKSTYTTETVTVKDGSNITQTITHSDSTGRYVTVDTLKGTDSDDLECVKRVDTRKDAKGNVESVITSDYTYSEGKNICHGTETDGSGKVTSIWISEAVYAYPESTETITYVDSSGKQISKTECTWTWIKVDEDAYPSTQTVVEYDENNNKTGTRKTTYTYEGNKETGVTTVTDGKETVVETRESVTVRNPEEDTITSTDTVKDADGKVKSIETWTWSGNDLVDHVRTENKTVNGKKVETETTFNTTEAATAQVMVEKISGAAATKAEVVVTVDEDAEISADETVEVKGTVSNSGNELTEVKVSIPKDYAEMLVKATAVEVKTNVGTLTISKDALKALAGKGGSADDNVVLTISKAKSEDFKLDGAKAAFDLNATVGDNTKAFQSGAGKITITVPMDAPQDGKQLVAYYVDDNNKTRMGGTFDGGVFSWDTDHFSRFEILEETVEAEKVYHHSRLSSTAATGTAKSAKTFDAGVGIYAASAILSVTGMAWVGKKKF